jgi:endonuclease/exonuclease/phosphatase family metal-dependent hydrolase
MIRRRTAAVAKWVLVGLLGWVLVEGGTGSANTPGNPEFDKPIEIRIPPAAASDRSSTANAINIVCWNINGGRDLPKVKTGLEKEPADLYLLQEVDSFTERTGKTNIPQDLAEQLHASSSFGIEFEELSQEGKDASKEREAYTGQATLTRLPMVKPRVLRFKHQSGFWSPHGWLPSSVPLFQRRLGGRIALITEHPIGGRLLVVYNVHYESRSYGRIQFDQLMETLEDMKQYPPGTAFVLAGDLNTKYLPSIFLDRLKREGFQNSTGDRIERTHEIAGSLDWIVARGPIKLEAGKVRRDISGSDHFPIYATLRWE